MKKEAIQICEEFISARLRFKDHLQVEMSHIQAAWKQVADGSATDCIKIAEKIIEELLQENGSAVEVQKWRSWKEEVVKIPSVQWAQEIHRFKVL